MRRAAFPVLALLLCFTPSSLAQDDSPAVLRREIDRMSERISELEARLERSQTRIDDLLAENRRLRAELKNGGGGGTSDGPDNDGDDAGADGDAAELPLDPFACADSMRASLERSWDAAFAGVDVTDEQQSRRYLRDVRSWAGKARRDHRGDFEWRVHVLAARNEGRRTVATVQAIDADGNELGGPVEIEATGGAARTVLQSAPNAELVISGNASVDIDVDARAGESGEDIGPYLRTTLEFTATEAYYG